MGGGGGIKKSEQEKALGEIARQQYNNYMQVYRPFEAKYTADVLNNAGARADKVAGRASADVAQQVSRPAITGLDPSAGKNAAIVGSNISPFAQSKANLEARQASEDQTASALQGIVNIGQGKESTVQSGMEQSADTAARRAIAQSQIRVGNRRSTMAAIGSAIGAAGAIGQNYIQNTIPGTEFKFNNQDGQQTPFDTQYHQYYQNLPTW